MSLARASLEKEGIAVAEGEDEERWRAWEIRRARNFSRLRVAYSAQWTLSMIRMLGVAWSRLECVDDGRWQKLNVTAFLVAGIAAAAPENIGNQYEDGSDNKCMLKRQ